MLRGVLATSLDLTVVFTEPTAVIGGRTDVENAREWEALGVETRFLALDHIDPPLGVQGNHVAELARNVAQKQPPVGSSDRTAGA